jgi:hypothetical protein
VQANQSLYELEKKGKSERRGIKQGSSKPLWYKKE